MQRQRERFRPRAPASAPPPVSCHTCRRITKAVPTPNPPLRISLATCCRRQAGATTAFAQPHAADRARPGYMLRYSVRGRVAAAEVGRARRRRRGRPVAAPPACPGLVLCQVGRVHPYARDQRQTDVRRLGRAYVAAARRWRTSAFCESVRQQFSVGSTQPALAFAPTDASAAAAPDDRIRSPDGASRAVAMATHRSPTSQ